MTDTEFIRTLQEELSKARQEISRLTLMLEDPYFCISCNKPYPRKAINQINHRCFACDNMRSQSLRSG